MGKMKVTQIVQHEVSLPLDETGYGSGHHSLIILRGPNKHALKKYVNEHSFVRAHNGDRPGQVYAYGLKCLKYLKGDYSWEAICISSSYWDV